jgi:hypothetical protein
MADKISLEVVNFKKELKRIEEEVLELGQIGVHEQIDYATDQLRIVTPVDTGEARKGWRNKKYNNIFRPESGVIINDVEHIVYLNNGSSQQAPKYFIEQVLSTIGVLTSD